MNARILVLTALVLSAMPLAAQTEGSVWYFGQNAGLDFTKGNPPPAAVTGSAMITNEGCSVISDLTGAVRFYTDGVTVWDRTNQVMQNGSGLLGSSSATQSALIVPLPGDCTKYFIFTVDSAEQGVANNLHGFVYSVVDMKMNAGLGALVPSLKNTPLQGLVSEKLTAVRDAGPSLGYWVVIHGFSNTSAQAPEATLFSAYHITSSGLSLSPVTSSVGHAHFDSNFGNAQGQMKISPDGRRLALAVTYARFVEIFDFDNSSGKVSNTSTYLDLSDITSNSYGIAFSPDSKALYVSTTASSPNVLLSFDLTAPNIAGSRSNPPIYSQTGSGNFYDLGALQLGPDGKIYVARYLKPFVGVIRSPNTPANPDFAPDAVPLAGNALCRLGLPTSVEGPFSCEAAPPPVVDPCCPPWNSGRLEDMLFYLGSGGIAAPYTLQFQPSSAFEAQIQAYINYLNVLNPAINSIIIAFRLNYAGTGSAPTGGPIVGLTHFVAWAAGGSGSPSNGPIDFFTLQNEPMQVNTWYRVHTGIFLNDQEQFFPSQCANNKVDVRIQVQHGPGAANPVLQIRRGDGRIVEKALFEGLDNP